MDDFACRVIEILRGGTHDGPGLRTTVFLKGCSLHCHWCQNPEGISAANEVWWEPRKCIRCLACVDACPANALSAAADGLRRDPEACSLCGACVAACPALALTFTGREWGLDDLVKEALKDRDYYRAFGGGVTVSGGEPLCQYPFVAEFCRRLQEAGVHTALDTCGLAPPEALAAVLPHVDHVLFDMKLLDPSLHQEYTGRTNEAIVANLMTVADHIRDGRRAGEGAAPGAGVKLWIRTPLIPGATATPENIAAIGRFIQQRLVDVTERWELCAFNGTCCTKYEKLGRQWPYADYHLLGQRTVAELRGAALSSGIAPGLLLVSGLIAND